MTAALIVLVALNAALFLGCVKLVWRFNVRMPELWQLLEDKGRAHRVREVHDEPRTNLLSTKYLYDEVDFDDRDVRELKLTLKVMHRVAVGSVLLFGVVITSTIALFERLASD